MKTRKLTSLLTTLLLAAAFWIPGLSLAADQRIQATEFMVGANHATLADTLNRLTLIEHDTDGTHNKAITQLTANKLVKANASKILAPSAISETANGEVTNASQPMVLAQVTSTVENVTGDTTEYSMAAAIWTEIYDQNADFSNGTFTAPVTGRYTFNLNLRLAGIVSTNTSLRIAAVASNRTIAYTVNPYAIWDSNYSLLSIIFPHDVDMDAGDTLYFTVTVGPTNKGVDIHSTTYLSIRLMF